MTTLLMLDTNAVSALVKGQAVELAARLERQRFCLSVITEAELRFGLARRPVHADLRRIVEQLLRGTDIRPWTSRCAGHCARLRVALEAAGRPLGAMDLMNASHALTEHCALVTADSVFLQVPGLEVVDWSRTTPITQEIRSSNRIDTPQPRSERLPSVATTAARKVAVSSKVAKKSPALSRRRATV